MSGYTGDGYEGEYSDRIVAQQMRDERIAWAEVDDAIEYLADVVANNRAHIWHLGDGKGGSSMLRDLIDACARRGLDREQGWL